MTGTRSATESADHAAFAHIAHPSFAQKAKRRPQLFDRMQSNNSIFASVWHQSVAVLASSLCSRYQGYQPCHLCLQMVNLQHHHMNISLHAAITCSLGVQAASTMHQRGVITSRAGRMTEPDL